MIDPNDSEAEGQNNRQSSNISGLERGVALIFAGAVLFTLIFLVVQPREMDSGTLAIVRFLAASFAGIAGYLFAGSFNLQGQIPFLSRAQIRATGAFGTFIVVLLLFYVAVPATPSPTLPSAVKTSTCEQQILQLGNALTSGSSGIAQASISLGEVETCVRNLNSIDIKHKAALQLVGIVFQDVGQPPIPNSLRDIRIQVVSLINEIKIVDLAKLFQGIGLESLDLVGMDFSNTNLRSVSFRDSFMIETDFSGATLDGADFTNTWLRNVNFDNASLRNMKLGGADWFNSLGLMVDQLRLIKQEGLLLCPQDDDAFHQVLRQRYYYPFESWSVKIQQELIKTWKKYLEPGSLCDQRASWEE